MKDELAELLLAKVMGWQEEQVAAQRPYLQAIASCKYDQFQQFSPEMRFVESLALWLNQFSTHEERQIAYEFVRDRMVFVSHAEMAHLVCTAYWDMIRERIMRRAAAANGIASHNVRKLSQSKEFRVLRRQSLFLGLRDGAHTDIFRRSNSDEIGHEQVYLTYEVNPARAESMLGKLREDLRKLDPGLPADNARFCILSSGRLLWKRDHLPAG